MRVHKKTGRGYVNPFIEVTTKKLLVESLDELGWSLTSERRNAGEWNAGRAYFAERGAERLHLWTTFTGDRTDWLEAWKTFCDLKGVEYGA